MAGFKAGLEQEERQHCSREPTEAYGERCRPRSFGGKPNIATGR